MNCHRIESQGMRVASWKSQEAVENAQCGPCQVSVFTFDGILTLWHRISLMCTDEMLLSVELRRPNALWPGLKFTTNS